MKEYLPFIITKEEAHIISRCLWYFDNETEITSARLNLDAHKEKGNQYEIDGFKKLIKRLKEQDKVALKLSKRIDVYLNGDENEE